MRYIGLDLGTKTIGISLSDKTATIASPRKTIRYTDELIAIEEVINIIKDEEVDEVVIGMPFNMNGTVGPSAQRTEDFIKKFNKLINIKVNIQDERLSTVEAEKVLISADVSRKKRKKVIDKMASVVILQNYLNKMKRRV